MHLLICLLTNVVHIYRLFFLYKTSNFLATTEIINFYLNSTVYIIVTTIDFFRHNLKYLEK